jgi:hypothetical protein
MASPARFPNLVPLFWQLKGDYAAWEAEFRRRVLAEAEQRSRSGLGRPTPRLEWRTILERLEEEG